MPKKRIKKKAVKKTSKSGKFNIKKQIGMFFLSLILIVITGIILYAIFIFPKEVSKKIKTDLIDILNPVSYDDTENTLIIETREEVDETLKSKISKFLYEKYNLDIKYISLNDSDESGIIKFVLLQNDKIFKDISNIYIYHQVKNEINIEQYKKHENNSSNIKKYIKEKLEKYDYKEKNEVNYKDIHDKIIPNEKHEKDIFVKSAKIAIVIDDVGYDYNQTKDLLNTGIALTYSIIPDAYDSRKSYNLLRQYHADMMLHIPMEPLKGKKYVEKNALFTDMSEIELRNRIYSFLNEYPDIKGANNHMGSKATNDLKVMNTLFSILSERNMFWLDSVTNEENKTGDAESNFKVRLYKRNVFIDNNKDPDYLRAQMNELIKEAKIYGYAVGIAHNQNKNLPAMLKEYERNEKELGIEFVPLQNIK